MKTNTCGGPINKVMQCAPTDHPDFFCFFYAEEKTYLYATTLSGSRRIFRASPGCWIPVPLKDIVCPKPFYIGWCEK